MDQPIYLHVRIKSNQGTYRCCNCYLYANNNKSTSHHNPAVTIACTTSAPSSYGCPHRSRAYNEILIDCEHLNSKNICPTVNRASNNLAVGTSPCLEDSTSEAEDGALQLLQSSQIAGETCGAELAKCPPVSINVINSENMHVCWCVQIANADTNVDSEGNVNSLSICPECRNIIKRQPSEHRYRLVSKRLLLANNIIVNRIDTQYLNAFFDVTKHRQDPYTPESVESHSPCPELNSTTTTTSSNSRSPYERNTVGVPSVMVGAKAHSGAAKTCGLIDGAALDHEQQQQQRGVVTPGQLKSRLEDLKRYSLNNSGVENGTAGDSDVEDVDDICQTSTAHKRHTSHWKQIDQVPAHLHQIASEILGDQADVWKEQSLVESRTRYIQISQICRNERQQSGADIQDMDGLAGQGCVTGECDTLSSASPDCRAESVAILKETTV